jgi:hypothetical protein
MSKHNVVPSRLHDTIWPLAVPITLLALWVAILAIRSGQSMLSRTVAAPAEAPKPLAADAPPSPPTAR